MATRLGVDVGGTFTDLIFYDDETGDVRVSKEPTTPAAPQEGVLAAVAAAVPAEKLAEAEYFLHGTTVGLNALLTRSGASVGLLATAGLPRRAGDPRAASRERDAEPLLAASRSRWCRGGCASRSASGSARRHGPGRVPDEDDVRRPPRSSRRGRRRRSRSPSSTPTATPRNELSPPRRLRRHGFKGEISLSHRVSGEYREYERTSTTVIDAYVAARGAATWSGSTAVAERGRLRRRR